MRRRSYVEPDCMAPTVCHILAGIVICILFMLGPLAGAAATLPAWLELRPGTVVRVAVAPWSTPDEPQAGLTQSAASLAADFTGNAAVPSDVVPEPVGVRVRVLRVLPRGIVLVRGVGSRRQAYALSSSLIPEVPAGTRLRAAGGFGGFAEFYSALDSPHRSASRLPTATKLVALKMGVATPDPDTVDLVRVFVRVTAGPSLGRMGWIAVAYTGQPLPAITPHTPAVERACVCRPLAFEDPP